jgi:hypothetical protein
MAVRDACAHVPHHPPKGDCADRQVQQCAQKRVEFIFVTLLSHNRMPVGEHGFCWRAKVQQPNLLGEPHSAWLCCPRHQLECLDWAPKQVRARCERTSRSVAAWCRGRVGSMRCVCVCVCVCVCHCVEEWADGAGRITCVAARLCRSLGSLKSSECVP